MSCAKDPVGTELSGPFSLSIARVIIQDCQTWEDWLVLMRWLREHEWG